MQDCKNCKWADVATNTRTITTDSGSLIITQVAGSVHCTNTHIRNITITDGELVCSEFEEEKHDA